MGESGDCRGLARHGRRDRERRQVSARDKEEGPAAAEAWPRVRGARKGDGDNRGAQGPGGDDVTSLCE